MEIGADCIKVTNLNSGFVHTIKFDDIDKVELSKFMRVSCVNIIPVVESYKKISSYLPKKERRRVAILYKRNGAVEQIYEHLLDTTVVAVYDEITESLNKYRETLNI